MWRHRPDVNFVRPAVDHDGAAAKRAFQAMMRMKKIDIAAIEAARRGPA
jgi:2-polyprenyl-6-hydroxyphenyl methylase/3-demethylubiquinone-9 3-methyltransferase